MIAYVTLGTNDMQRALGFYDALLAEIGAKRLFGMDRIQFYGTGTKGPMLAVCIPHDEKPHAPGNGWMVAIPGGSREAVDKLYARALELGASDEGAPASASRTSSTAATSATSTATSCASWT
jgi:catechol 2,3-dioxygenase-like lactoylglutathione lyase family enzyme